MSLSYHEEYLIPTHHFKHYERVLIHLYASQILVGA